MAKFGLYDILAKISNLGKNDGYDRLRLLFFISEIVLLVSFITSPYSFKKILIPFLDMQILGFISKDITIGMIIAIFAGIGVIGTWLKRI